MKNFVTKSANKFCNHFFLQQVELYNMRILLFLLFSLSVFCSHAQMPSMGGPEMSGNAPMAAPGGGHLGVDTWDVNVNVMDPSRRERITAVVDAMHQQGATRGIASDILKASGFSLVSSFIDIVATETLNLAKMRKRKKQEWMRMIQNECNYTDSIYNIKGLKDFYQETSRYGALDPANINFDGVSIRGFRDGQEVIFLSCHIDTTRLAHLFQHSKFHLVVDTISFNPYKCHLPNLMANGIRMAKDSKRDNTFSFNERNRLTVGLELTLTSSWINEAVMVQRNVELGRFKLEFVVPENAETYHYSRKEVERNRRLLQERGGMQAGKPSDVSTDFVEVEGDCFVVPRSYMPVGSSERMWGTGEYNIKVKFRESCQFSQDATRNEKLRHWRKDYKRLCKMRKKGSRVTEYFRTVWSQNGDQIVKSVIKQGLNTGAQGIGLSSSASKAGGGAMPGGTMPSGGAMPAGKQ